MTTDDGQETKHQGPATLPRNVRLLGWVSFLNDAAGEMIYPLLPTFLMTVLGGNKLSLGLIEGTADSAASLLKLWSGSRSDRVGKRKIFIVLGYLPAALARPVIGLATAAWHLFALRTIDRVGKGIRSAPRDALVADSTDAASHGRAFGFQQAMDHAGAAVGPLAAFVYLWFRPEQYRELFLLSIFPGLLVVALVLVLQEKPIHTPAAKEFAWTLQPFGREFRWYLLALLVFTLGNSSDAFLLVRAGELGVSTPMLLVLWPAAHVVKSIGNVLAGRAVNTVGARRMIVAGWVVYAVVYLLFGLATDQWHAWALFLFYGLFFALTEPAEKTLVAELAGERKGLAYGWFNFAVGIGVLPASALFGWLYQDFGPVAAFGWGAGAALAAALMLSGMRSRSAVTTSADESP